MIRKSRDGNHFLDEKKLVLIASPDNPNINHCSEYVFEHSLSTFIFRGIPAKKTMQILNSLIPIFSVIGLGMILRKCGFLTSESTDAFNRFAYFFALPVFLFYKLGSAPPVTGLANQFMGTLMAATLFTIAFGWLVTRCMDLPPGSRGALIQSCFRGNLAFMALPLILFATYHLPEKHRTEIESAVLIGLPPVVILYNVASVAVLAIYNNRKTKKGLWIDVSWKMVTNPLLLACLAGLAMKSSGLAIPTAIFRTCEVLGASAFPLALLGIGSQLVVCRVKSQLASSMVSTAIKCVICPLFGYFVALNFGLSGPELQVVLILCAVPTAVSSFVLADQMNSDSELAASSVVICTACSLATLSGLLWLTG
ncbi:MAG: AEC family transporter [Planctomycetota bacterium]